MLDTTTKKRIDDCRDILVGKLPDPKAQIEQITIGLIYKFMDDMDKEAIELDGQAKFFSNYEVPDPENPGNTKTVEFGKYSWDNLFDAKVTATELLNLYSEAITEMDKNPNIPALFRDIFKNAFLPYRDPETLKLFLKTIGEFEYSHSEKLGDAFEYLLSVMGSQGDAGQFRTPRHIIDFLVKVIDPGKNDTILDPACGTAGFLISAFKHIKKKNHNELTPDEQKKLIQNFVGYDISPDMVRLSLVNLYLHGFSDPHIHEYDTLSSEERWNESYDVILANPPFMSPKGGIRPHKKFTISSNRSEVLFIDYIAEHLTPKGKAGVIVPEGIIFQSGKAYKELRKMLVENYLYAVVSLPAGVFNPYSGVKTSILLMDKEVAKQKDEILFVKIDNDGFSLGAQRNEMQGSQLQEAIDVIYNFCHPEPSPELDSGSSGSEEGKDSLPIENTLAHPVPKTQIAKNGEYNLSGESYRNQQAIGNTAFPIVELGDIMEFKYGKPLKKADRKGGDFPVYGSNGVVGYHNEFIVDSPFIVVGRKGSAGALNYSEFPGYPIDTTFFIENDKPEKINIKYAFHILSTLSLDKLNVQAGIPGLNRNDAYELKVPLPPLYIQEEIVVEIEGYQKIIDGAKAVVENYTPTVDIDPDWEMVELGEVCHSFQYGSSKKSLKEGEVVCLRMGNIQNGEIDWTDLKYAPEDEDLEKYLLEPEDVLFNRTNSPVHVGKTGIYRGEKKAVFAGYLIRLNYKKDSILGEYLNYCLNSKEAKAFCQRVKKDGINQSNINAKVLSTFRIPLPEIDIQSQIVYQVRQELELVNANKQLIEIFEQKIKDRIAKVWGEGKVATETEEVKEVVEVG